MVLIRTPSVGPGLVGAEGPPALVWSAHRAFWAYMYGPNGCSRLRPARPTGALGLAGCRLRNAVLPRSLYLQVVAVPFTVLTALYRSASPVSTASDNAAESSAQHLWVGADSPRATVH